MSTPKGPSSLFLSPWQIHPVAEEIPGSRIAVRSGHIVMGPRAPSSFSLTPAWYRGGGRGPEGGRGRKYSGAK